MNKLNRERTMEIFVLLIGLPIIVGLLIAFGTAVLAAFSYIFVGALSLAINFWYITLAIMLVLLAPLIYLNSWLFGLLAAIVIFFTVAWFLGGDTEQIKAEIERKRIAKEHKL